MGHSPLSKSRPLTRCCRSFFRLLQTDGEIPGVTKKSSRRLASAKRRSTQPCLASKPGPPSQSVVSVWRLPRARVHTANRNGRHWLMFVDTAAFAAVRRGIWIRTTSSRSTRAEAMGSITFSLSVQSAMLPRGLKIQIIVQRIGSKGWTCCSANAQRPFSVRSTNV